MSRSFSGKTKGSGKTWMHPPEALLRGHIVYNVKFLGHVEVETPKGTEVVKEAIRKMKFNKHIKKAEGQKPPKVELTISVDGVTVQEPKYKVTQHQYPLHRISYCADDKSDKRMFTFIAKEADGNKHFCFVFDSQQCAEEITLTIGQAFDLAYKKFLETSGKDMDTKKHYLLLQKKVQQLTEENLTLKARVADLERLIDPRALDEFDKRNTPAKPISPVQSPTDEPVVGRKLENLIMDDEYATVMKNGNTSSGPTAVPALAPPPKVPSRHGHPHPPSQTTPTTPQGSTDLFGATPFTTSVTSPSVETGPPIPARPQQPQNPFMSNGSGGGSAGDPFGMSAFNPNATQQELDKQIQGLDRDFLDLQAGFSRGLTMGTDDFSLEDLDPLNNKK